jgi:hypothetical protein
VDPSFAVEQVGGEGGLPVRPRWEEADFVEREPTELAGPS